MAGYRKNLGDIYKGILQGKQHTSGPKLSDMYGEVINEQDQGLLNLGLPGTGKQERKQDAIKRIRADFAKRGQKVSDKQARAMLASDDNRYIQQQFDKPSDDPVEDIEFKMDDLDELNALSPMLKAKIYNQMNKGVTYQLQSVFAENFGKENKYTHLGSDIVSQSYINVGGLLAALTSESGGIDIDKLKTVGTYKAVEIFEPVVLEALTLMKGVGVGASQAGPYEHALAMLSSRIDLHEKGDIAIDGVLIELKAESGRVGIEGWPNGDVARSTLHKLVKATNNEDFIKEIQSIPKTLGMKQLFELVNKHELETAEKEHIAANMFRFLYGDHYAGLVDRFTNSTSYEEVYIELQKTLYNSYKNSKSNKEGGWTKLIGFNLITDKGVVNPNATVAVVETAEQFVETPKYTSSPSVIPSGIGASPRDYMFDFRPMI